MNKRELIARVQRYMGAGASRDAARAAVNAVLESILLSARTTRVPISKLGVFEYKERRGARRLCFRPARRLVERTTGSCHALPETPPEPPPGQPVTEPRH